MDRRRPAFIQFLDGSGEVVLWSGEEEVSELEIEGIARAVSANGNVVTGYAVISGRVQAFRWEKETGAVPLGDLQTENLEESRAFGISADGTTVVGFAATDSGARQAFRWTEADGMQDLTLGMVGRGAAIELGIRRIRRWQCCCRPYGRQCGCCME